MNLGMIQRRIQVRGRVQGVGFRASTVAAAQRFPELKGFVRNLPDGSVEAVFTGEQTAVLWMAAWCKEGPPAAHVTGIVIKEETVDSNLKLFGVL